MYSELNILSFKRKCPTVCELMSVSGLSPLLYVYILILFYFLFERNVCKILSPGSTDCRGQCSGAFTPAHRGGMLLIKTRTLLPPYRVLCWPISDESFM